MDDRSGHVIAAALSDRISRRQFLQFVAIGVLGTVIACGNGGEDTNTPGDGSPEGVVMQAGSPVAPLEALSGSSRLTARPLDEIPSAHVTTGLQSLGMSRPADAILYVPSSYAIEAPAPLAILFHGAGGDASSPINTFRDRSESNGIILLAIKSRDVSWDITVTGEFGVDIAFLDRALGAVFSRFAVDPARIAVAGFSDGASYALAVGLSNGALISDIIAFSPGFLAPGEVEGKPRIFVSHGTQDIVLPIEQTSRTIVPQLRQAGYDVEYIEFNGLHMVPDDIIDAAVDWWLQGG